MDERHFLGVGMGFHGRKSPLNPVTTPQSICLHCMGEEIVESWEATSWGDSHCSGFLSLYPELRVREPWPDLSLNIYWAPLGKLVACLGISFSGCKMGIRIPSLQSDCTGRGAGWALASRWICGGLCDLSGRQL